MSDLMMYHKLLLYLSYFATLGHILQNKRSSTKEELFNILTAGYVAG